MRALTVLILTVLTLGSSLLFMGEATHAQGRDKRQRLRQVNLLRNENAMGQIFLVYLFDQWVGSGFILGEDCPYFFTTHHMMENLRYECRGLECPPLTAKNIWQEELELPSPNDYDPQNQAQTKLDVARVPYQWKTRQGSRPSINLQPVNHLTQTGDALLTYRVHPEEGRFEILWGRQVGEEYQTEIRPSLNHNLTHQLDHGDSGLPLFNSSMQIIGIHHGHRPLTHTEEIHLGPRSYKQAIPMAYIGGCP